jgi:hypothetical protein
MDLANVGRQILNDKDAGAIRSAMSQKREALRCIEREMAQLAENKRGIEEDLVRLGAVLAPHMHSLVPNEVLSHIFVLLALGHGPVEFPIPKDNAPPQFAISHVSSRWRRVALHTPELWSDMYLIYPRNGLGHLLHLHQLWLIRARTFPVTLSIWFHKLSDSDELAVALQSILFPIQIKRLCLRITYEQFIALSTLPTMRLSEFELDVMFPFNHEDLSMNDPHPLVTRLQSLTFRFKEPNLEALNWIDSLRPCLPWSQLRSLNFCIFVQDLHPIFGILRQTPMLEALALSICRSAVLDPLLMPLLRTLAVNINLAAFDNNDHTQILRSFTCPSLTKFSLVTCGSWTREILEILKRQYNMQGLREFEFKGPFALHVSSCLRSAPMLHSLSLRQAVLDDEAITGVSNGSLGRFLRKLEIQMKCDVGDLFGMVEARKKMVDELIKNGCSWREGITVLKDVVVIPSSKENLKGYKERIIALKAAGIAITFL